MPIRLPLGLSFESNPFAAEVPRDVSTLSETLYNYLDFQADQLRNQLNLSQVGDTTNGWQVLTVIDSKARWNLGSDGVFVHPIFGIIKARYVRFDSPDQTVWSGSPVGLALSPVGFSHGATTNIAQSGSNLVLGQQAGYVVPVDQSFGWVVREGVNLQSLLVRGAKPVAGDRLNWAANGLSAVGTENTYATVVGGSIMEVDSTHWDCAPGSVFISV